MADLESLLKSAPIPQSAKADAWDAYQASKNEDDLADRLTKLQVPKSVAADMWDLKRSESAVPAAPTGPQVSPQELATRQAASKATAEANQPSLVKGFLSEVGRNIGDVANVKQNLSNLGSAVFNTATGTPEHPVATGLESTGNLLLDTAGAALGGYGLAKGINAIPRLGRAGEAFGTLMGTLENNPVTQGSKLASIVDAITDAKKLGKSGVELPAVVKATENALSGSTPVTYGDLRGLAQTAGRKVGLLERAFNPPDPRMETAIGKLYGSLTDAARSVASDAGLGDLYDQAVNEYRRATKLRQLGKLGLAGGAGALGIGKALGFVNTIRDITGY